MKRIFFLMPCFLLALSCSTSKKAVKGISRNLDTLVVSAKNNPLDLYRATETKTWDIVHTRAALSFDYQNRTADGKAWIQLHPYFYETDSLVLDAKSMEVDSVMLEVNNQYRPLSFRMVDDKLHISFPQTVFRQDTQSLYVKYKAKPYAEATGGSKAISDDRGLYFINSNREIPNKPVQIWTQGETESNSHWLPTIDHPNERMTVQLELTVPDSFKTLSNGAMKGSRRAGNHLRTDTWRTDQPIQVYAIMFAIGDFTVVEDAAWNGVPVNYYVEPEYAPYARDMFQHTTEMIDYFSKITGVPYPWNKYSQVVVRDYVSGAMENTSASLFGEFMNQNRREIQDKNYEDVVSHELFHQWFGDYVTAESWSNLTLNESFANYGEQLWRSFKYGQASSDELGFNDLAKYLGQTTYNDEPLVRFHYHQHEDMFDRISYEKGGAILHYLHGLIGDSAFFKAMNVYLSENALKPAEVHQWRIAVEEVTGQDWNWFFNQWYYRGGHPQLTIRYEYDEKKELLTVHTIQSTSDNGKAFRLPMKALLHDGTTAREVDWLISEKSQSFSFPYKKGLKPLFIPDSRHWLVGILKEGKTPEQWYQQLTLGEDYIDKRRAVSSAFQLPKDSFSQKIFQSGLKDSMDGIRTHSLVLLQRLGEKVLWKRELEDDILHLALSDKSISVRAAAFDVVGQWKIKGAKKALIQAIQDSSYKVAGSALSALTAIDPDTAYVLSKIILSQAPKASLEQAVWASLAAAGKEKDISFFEQRAITISGSSRITFANYLNQYIVRTGGLTGFDRGMQLLATMAAKENIKSYRFAIGSLIFNTYNYYDEQVSKTSDSEKKQQAQERKELSAKYKELILKEEADPEIRKKYQAL